MKRFALLAILALAACEPPPPRIVTVPAPPPPPEPRRDFTDDNLPFDLTEGADINAIPPEWIQIFCNVEWETRAEPVTGTVQWNPCKRPDMFNDGPRPEVAEEPADDFVAEIEAALEELPEDEADPLARPSTQITTPQVEFDLPPDPSLVLNPDGSYSRPRF
ncbi:hypothetical protein [Pontivivens ytuae]|uniref:Uncharacterized protein n=1 Tax=Pontivivens ytuae TaxID=2789856 RepID=A0A7S9LUR6_9RHOB|nr:hypothetical protein [Pontivivens ytuae]QPH55696.1 hypothetical protein I0K15_08210 [Pontivivens ytuae]